MSVLISIALFLGWACIGGASLKRAGVFSAVDSVLLAPSVGIAIVTVLISAASFMGVAIDVAAWLAATALIVSIFVLARARDGWRLPALVYAVLIFANLAIVGMGLFRLGGAWQGLVNGDGAIASLAAQYFTSHSFLDKPAIAPIFAGTDYSGLASIVYVFGGQRFGDAMLLGSSARLFGLHPDEIYMAHALAVRCAMLAAAGLLIPRLTVPRTLFVLLVLSLSPLGAYAYLNQLTSQIGGMALLFATVIVYARFLQNSSAPLRHAVICAVLGAALCEAYPESLPYLALCAALLTLHQHVLARLPGPKQMLQFAAATLLVIATLTAAALAHVLVATANILSWGGVIEGGPVRDVGSTFSFAFLPDAFAYLTGLEALGEAFSDPLASLLVGCGFIFCFVLLVFIAMRARAYALMSAMTVAALVVFALFFLKDQSFGSFKNMILVQPLAFAALAQLLMDAFDERRIWTLCLGSLALLAIGRSDAIYVQRSLQGGALPQLASSHLLDRIGELANRSPTGAVLETQGGLLERFAMLREKSAPLRTSTALRNIPALGSFLAHLAGNPFARLLPSGTDFISGLLAEHARRYREEAFACDHEIADARIVLDEDEDLLHMARIVPGSALTPLNGLLGADGELVYADSADTRPLLVARSSNIGGNATINPPALFGQQGDFALPGEHFAGVGRYLPLELLAPAEAPVRVRVSLTRTPFGGEKSRLRAIRIVGEESTEIGGGGGGALDLVSPPLHPCLVHGRAFVLIDFGPEEKMPSRLPYIYRFLNIAYAPDARAMSGFLRDISVVRAEPPVPVGAEVAFDWNFRKFDANFEFGGVYEDGWISDQLRLRPRGACCAKRVQLDFDVPGQAVAEGPVTAAVAIRGKVVAQQRLVAGRNSVSIDLAESARDYVDISVDRPLILPGADHRSVLGLLRHISLQ